MSFYLTTPLYYVNDLPHIGHSYTTVIADVLTRYHRLFGEDTLLLTGTDEHGQKCQDAASARGVSAQAHVDEMAKNYIATWKDLNIDYDIFFRTTSEFHKKAVQASLQQLFDQGDIYEDTYEGWYSVSEEIFYTEKDLVDGKSPTGKEVQKVKERNYFFKMSQYQKQLIEHIEAHPKFIQPEAKRNEVLGFLKEPLGDLCISRPLSRLNWGVPLPFDKDYVTYVWFDALLNYATGVGFQQTERKEDFDKWWNKAGARHLIGKDILVTHCVYWTAMLLSMKQRLPETIFAHGWILNKDQGKMSKSEGQVVSPLDMLSVVGVDSFRYFLCREIHLGNDGPFSEEILLQRVNNDLANNLGNLFSRSTNLIEKFFDGKPPKPHGSDKLALEIRDECLKLPQLVQADIMNFRLSYAIEKIFLVLDKANQYLEARAPWKLAKIDLVEAGKVLGVAVETLRIVGTLLQPVMPEKSHQLLQRLGVQSPDWESLNSWPAISEDHRIEKGNPLFPRIQKKD